MGKLASNHEVVSGLYLHTFGTYRAEFLCVVICFVSLLDKISTFLYYFVSNEERLSLSKIYALQNYASFFFFLWAGHSLDLL